MVKKKSKRLVKADLIVEKIEKGMEKLDYLVQRFKESEKKIQPELKDSAANQSQDELTTEEINKFLDKVADKRPKSAQKAREINERMNYSQLSECHE